MLASNPVDPAQRITIDLIGPDGPASPLRRDDEAGFRSALTGLAVASLVGVAIVVGLFATASAPAPAVIDGPQPVDIGGGPAGKVPGAQVPGGPVAGEFRLGPGNNAAPGIVVPLAPAPAALQTPVPGDFRLAPGNNPAPGLVAPVAPAALGTPVPGDFRLGPGNNEAPGLVR